MASVSESDTSVRPRPGALRALGEADPPVRVEVGGRVLERLAVLKHDSFAATALYEDEHGRVVCKFNRAAPVFGVPMRWLGRYLAGKERRPLQRLAGVPGIPREAGAVLVDGREQAHAVAHEYVEGHPLGKKEAVGDDFFAMLEQTLAAVHERGVAHVDLNKRENIIVGDDGRPYLIDYQIAFVLPGWWPGNSWAVRWFLRLLQRSDAYHLLKHRQRLRPDQLPAAQRSAEAIRPWWIRLWRGVASPFRRVRRGLLVRMKVRSGRGQADSEAGPEEAFRR